MRELLTSLPAAVAYVSGPDLIVDFANEACSRLITDRDLLGRPLATALPELADRMDILHKIMKTGETVRGSEAMVRFSGQEDGEQLFLDYVCQPVRDADGDVTGILLYATDVTAHVQGRLELEETAVQLTVAEERLRGLFETMPQGVVHYGADGSVLSTNP
ncbi:MAG TPA: PAS domain-containing protein, partial [Streptosporangiaceae bacterium]|nr:PAS domain-containing protein [Streptosporangiaceae bacterium]